MPQGCAPGGLGAPGGNGTAISSPASSGKPALDGVLSIRPVSQPELPFTPPPLWLTALFQDIQREYINTFGSDSTTDCVDRLAWLQKIVLSGKQTAQRTNGAKSDLATYDSITLAIKSLLTNIALGLDIYGRSQNYITLVSYDTISALLATQLANLDAIQKARDTVAQQQRSQADRLTNLAAAVNSLNDSLAQSQDEIATSSKRVSQLQDEISAGLADLGVLWGQLASADQAFRDAVQQTAGGGCDFSGVLRCAALVTTIVTTGGAGIGLALSLGQAFQGLQQINSAAAADPAFSFGNIQSEFKQITQIVKPVGNSLDSFKQAYQSMKPALDRMEDAATPAPDVPGIPSDYTKLVASKADFDRQIEPYLALPQARQYQALMNRFVAVAETRNNKIIEHDATIAHIQNVYAAMAARKAGSEQLALVTQENFDPSLDQNLLFIDAQLDALKVAIVREIADMAKSVEYTTLSKPSVVFGDYTPSALRAATTQITSDYHNAMVQFGSPPSTAEHIRVRFDRILTGKSLDSFLNGAPMIIAVPSDRKHDPFIDWYGVQTVALTVEDASGNRLPHSIKFYFENQGRSLVYDEHRTPMIFSHTAAIRGLYSQDARKVISSSGTVLDDSGRWLGVSPYGPWRVKISADTGAARVAVSNACLTFKIRGRVMKF